MFFLYAVRYYISIITVLFGKGNNTFNNYDSDKLNFKNKKEPFISIHLPMYNEKNVVERIMKACTSLDYTNYEIIVVDDSTDETFQILNKNWNNHPKVKIVHREKRKGFKGGALNEALKHMNPRAEYVLIFDADFIPPPDIMQRFLGIFKISTTGTERIRETRTKPRFLNALRNGTKKIETAAVQGYQWHMLNAGENWLTRGVRVEYSGNYMIERTCQEVLGSMKMIAGSVFMVKANVLKKYGWSTSLTEDWELTLRLYMGGYKVIYTPLIQAPAECPSTFRRLVRQRCRWAEGHTFNVKRYFGRVLRSSRLSGMEKFEFVSYYALYYLQPLLFCVGMFFWFLSEWMHKGLIFSWWVPPFGWALVLFNLFSLPLMGLAGLFLERSVKKSATGILSFVIISFVLAPFQAYYSLKGLFERKEGRWVRTFKTGKITEAIVKLKLRKIMWAIMPRKKKIGIKDNL